MKRLALVVAGILVVAFPLTLRAMSNSAEPTVEIVAASQRALAPSVLASGVIIHTVEAQLSPEVVGKVTEILVGVGDEVVAGQVVLRIDETSYLAEVEKRDSLVSARNLEVANGRLAVTAAQRKLERARALTERGFLAASSLEDAQLEQDRAQVALDMSRANAAQAAAELRQALESLSRTAIKAPISGRVLSIDIEVGETTAPSNSGIAGSNLMTIADPDSLRIRVDVDENSIGEVAPGQRAAIFPAALSDTAVAGVVERLDLVPARRDRPAAGSRAYSIDVRLLSPPDPRLRSGMTCRAELFTAVAVGGVSIPIQAVLPNAGPGVSRADQAQSGTVFVVTNGRVAARRVLLGSSDDSLQLVVSGLTRGDRVVSGPARILRDLKDGDKVAEQAR